MPAVTIQQFGGIQPRTSERLIPDTAAQVAVNCRLSNGELIPLKEGRVVYSSAKVGPLLTVERITEGDTEAWLTWAEDVDVVKAPLYGVGRWCYTGDGEPRITTLADAISGGSDDYPAVSYTLGTPKPATAPSVGHSGGVGSATDRYYAYTFYASWGSGDDLVEFEGAVSPISVLTTGKVDGTWAITGMDASPPNSGTVTGAYASSKTEFTDTVDHFLRVGEQVVISGATLTITDITSTKKFKVAGDYHAATAWARKAAFPGTIYKRLYRTTGTTGQWQLVAEGISATSYNDTLTDAQIPGDELISSGWDMPPAGLVGLFELPSGALGGFVGNKLMFSEPYQPHAWPAEYAVVADYPIVGAECFGSGVGAATTAWPYIIQGVEPGTMRGESWKAALPASSKRSVISAGDMVLYASRQGIVAVHGAGAAVWSLRYFTDTEFKDLAPETMVSALSSGRLYVRYELDGVTRALVFNLTGDDSHLTETHFQADGGLVGDKTNGRLYYTIGSDIYEADSEDGYTLYQDWMSKEFYLSSPKNLGAARVRFDSAIDAAQAEAIAARIAEVEAANAAAVASGNVRGAWGESGWGVMAWGASDIEKPPEEPPANTVNFQLYVDGELKSSRTVTDQHAFRLPSGYKSEAVAVRVQSQCRIKSIELGDTPKSLGSTPA